MQKKKKNIYFLNHCFQLAYRCAVFSFFMLVMSGIFLAWHYLPTPQKAFSSLLEITSTTFAGSALLNIHVTAGIFFIVCIIGCFCALAADVNRSAYWIKAWNYSSIIMVCYVWSMISGYILSATPSATNLFESIVLSAGSQSADTDSVTVDILRNSSFFSHAFFRQFLIHTLLVGLICTFALYNFAVYSKKLSEYGTALPLSSKAIVLLTSTLVATFALAVKPGSAACSVQTRPPLVVAMITTLTHHPTISSLIVVSVALFCILFFGGIMIKKYRS